MAAQAQAQPQTANFAPQGVSFGAAQGLPFINPLLAQVKIDLSIFVGLDYRETFRVLA